MIFAIIFILWWFVSTILMIIHHYDYDCKWNFYCIVDNILSNINF